MKRPTLWICYGAMFTALAVCTMANAAGIISLNFSENSANQEFAGGQDIGPLGTDSTNWNNTNGQPDLANGTITDLIDDNGATTTAWVSWSAANPWYNEDGVTDDQHKLSVGYLDDGGDAILIDLFDIPYANYRVYGLYSSDQSNGTTGTVTAQDMQVNGTWVFGGTTATSVDAYGSITDSLANTGQFWSHLTDTTPGNYWTIDISGTTSLNIVQSPTADPGRAAISALIIRDLDAPFFDSTLKIVVDRDTGNVTLTNNTNAAVDFAGMGTLSTDGALTPSPSGWKSITGNYDSNGDSSVSSDEWLHLANTETELSEGTLGTGTLAHGESVDLGAAWYKYYRETTDLRMEYLDANTGETINGLVEFTGNDGLTFGPGDFDFDNDVDATDWIAIRDGFNGDYSALTGARAYRFGDMDGDQDVDSVDLVAFKTAYEVANPGSSFAGMVAGVPEPSTGLLLGLGTLLMGLVSSRKATRMRIGSILPMLFAAVTTTFILTGAASADMAPGAITGVTGTAFAVGDNADPGDGSISRILDGAGLTVGAGGPSNWTHNAGWPANWQGGENAIVTIEPGLTPGAWFVADLGTAYTDLNSLYIWNVREGTATNRGAKDIDLYYSVTPSVTPVTETAYDFSSGGWTLLGSYEIPQGADGGGTPSDLTIDLSGISNAQHVGFDISTNWGSDFRVGFAELQFITGPDQSYQLTLEVNTTTGNVRILNDAMTEVQDIDYFEITSAAAALDSSGWSPMGSGTDDGSDWEALGNLSDSLLAQFYLQGSTPFADGESAALGHAYGGGAEDLEFRYHVPGLDDNLEGLVTYVTGGVVDNADFDADGDVDGADFLTWQTGFGGTGGLADGDANNDTNINGTDRTIWEGQFGTGGAAAGLASSAVPEPSTLGLLGLAMVGLAIGFIRRKQGGEMMHVTKMSLLIAVIAGLAFAPIASADYTLDRQYQMGEADTVFGSQAVAGDTVEQAVDSKTTSPPGDQQDLLPGIFIQPTYVNLSTVGTGRTGLGIQFAGEDEFGEGGSLTGDRLGFPADSIASTGYDPAGPLDYSGISHRGIQAWVYPSDPGAGTQDIIMDTLAHGVRISDTGTWVMRYWGPGGPEAGDMLDYDTGIAVTTDWHHVQVVRAPRSGTPNRASTFYLDGVAVALGLDGYYDGSNNNHPLVLGANSGDADTSEADVADAGTENFFVGVLDDVDLFIHGTTTSNIEYGNFNPGTDNPLIAADWGTVADGDINADGNVDDDDVDLFVSNWRVENLVMGYAAGDGTSRGWGDFNYDGTVNFSDWYILRANHPGGANLNLGELLAGVPEPSSILLLLLGAAAALMIRRRR